MRPQPLQDALRPYADPEADAEGEGEGEDLVEGRRGGDVEAMMDEMGMEELVIEPMTAEIGEFEDEEDDDELHPLDFDFDAIEDSPSVYKRCQIVIARIKSTRTCFIIYILMALACVTIFITAAFGSVEMRNSAWIRILEAFINVLLMLEVATDIVSEGWGYWKKLGNVADFIVTTACVLFFFTFLEEDQNAFGNDSLPLNAVLLGIRYSFQLFRAFLCAVRGHTSMQIIGQDEVEVHDLELKNMVRMNAKNNTHTRRHSNGLTPHFPESDDDSGNGLASVRLSMGTGLPRLRGDSESSSTLGMRRIS